MPYYFRALVVIVLFRATSGAAGGAKAEVVLARQGKRQCTIVVSSEGTDAEKYAAEELRTHLAQMIGCDISVQTDVVLKSPMIIVGPGEVVKAVAPKLCLETMGREELVLRTEGPHLILAGGRPRGTVYAVYEFLEKYLGCRWYTRDITYVPKKKTITLGEIDHRYNPPFMYREILYQEAYVPQFAGRLRLNGGYNHRVRSGLPGGAVVIHPFVHTFHYLVPPKKYFKNHPEYYSLVGGRRVANKQLCLTNPDVLRIATEKVVEWIERNPETVVFSVSQNDGYGACTCRECQAVVKEEGTEMAPILRFVNRIADEVGKKYPEKYIETLSYAYSETPTRKTKPRENVIIRLCHWHPGCNVHGVATCTTNENYRKELDDWIKLARHVFIWDYMVTFHEYLAPFPNWWAIGEDTRYYAEKGVDGVMWQGNHKSLGGEMSDLRTYIAGQMLWNPYQNVDTVIDDFLNGVYGPSAGPIRAYMDMVRDHVVKNAICRNRTPVRLPAEMMARARELFRQAERRAPSRDIRERVKKAGAVILFQLVRYPETYGLDEREALAVLSDLREVVERHTITHVRESVAAEMEGWLRKRQQELRDTYRE